jgi:hypothetical protein
MNMATKNNIFDEKLKEYLQASTKRKGEIIKAVVEVTRMHRKSVIRRFKVLQLKDSRLPEGRGRPTYFTKDVDAALYTIWNIANQPCGELLYPSMAEYVTILKRDRVWMHSDEATGKLLAMSEHTVRRRTANLRQKHGITRGLSTTKPSQLKTIIPIFKGPWKDLSPGNGQLDTVAHCGSTLSGDYVFSLNYTDAATYWVVLRAQWNKGQAATVASIEQVKQSLPVPLHQLHPDTGSEFINWLLKGWCDDNEVLLTRSEPGKSNDNMYVEERNGHVVRKYLGYTRFDCPEVTDLINELYETLALYLNHFQTVRRTVSKTRVGAKYIRVYEKVPLTAYQRMLDHPDVSDSVKQKLKAEHKLLSPLVLKDKIDNITSKIMNKQRDFGKLR